jgi:hypothetical protein
MGRWPNKSLYYYTGSQRPSASLKPQAVQAVQAVGRASLGWSEDCSHWTGVRADLTGVRAALIGMRDALTGMRAAL